MGPVYATPLDMWQMALPPDTLFQDQGIEPGTWTSPVKSGTGTGSMAVALESNPRSDFSVLVRCVSGGELNVYGLINPGAVPRFVISLDAGVTFSPQLTPKDDGCLAFQKGGFTVEFENGLAAPSFNVNDEWTFSTTASPDVLRFLSAASRYVDGKLKNTYSTPLTEWGDDLKLVVCQIARWFLILRRGLDKGQDFEVYKPVDAFLWLEETGKGYNQAAVKENGSGFVFADWMVARAPFRTGWRF